MFFSHIQLIPTSPVHVSVSMSVSVSRVEVWSISAGCTVRMINHVDRSCRNIHIEHLIYFWFQNIWGFVLCEGFSRDGKNPVPRNLRQISKETCPTNFRLPRPRIVTLCVFVALCQCLSQCLYASLIRDTYICSHIYICTYVYLYMYSYTC